MTETPKLPPTPVGWCYFKNGRPNGAAFHETKEALLTSYQFRGDRDLAILEAEALSEGRIPLPYTVQIVPEEIADGYLPFCNGIAVGPVLGYSHLVKDPERTLHTVCSYYSHERYNPDVSEADRKALNAYAFFGYGRKKVNKKEKAIRKKAAEEVLSRFGVEIRPVRIVALNHDATVRATSYRDLNINSELTPAPNPDSPGYLFVSYAAKHLLEQQGYSKDRSHSGIHTVARNAIVYGLTFADDDFVRLTNETAWRPREEDYAIACGSERGTSNRSAARAYEVMKGRRPFIVKDPETPSGRHAYVGLSFEWYGEKLTVTSFAEDGGYLIACTYQQEENLLRSDAQKRWWRTLSFRTPAGYRIVESASDDERTLTLSDQVYPWEELHGQHGARVKRRIKISHDDLKEYAKSMERVADLEDRIRKLPSEMRLHTQHFIEREFGTKRRLSQLAPAQIARVQTEVATISALIPTASH